ERQAPAGAVEHELESPGNGPGVTDDHDGGDARDGTREATIAPGGQELDRVLGDEVVRGRGQHHRVALENVDVQVVLCTRSAAHREERGIPVQGQREAGAPGNRDALHGGAAEVV